MIAMNDWRHDPIRTEKDMAALVSAYGFLPLLQNDIPGFSVEEHTAPEVWFADGVDGPWEWKGPVIQSTGAAYGKFFHGASGFISPAWYADFANYRRDGCDLDDRFADGLVRYEDKYLFDLLDGHAPILSTELKRLGGFGNGGRKGFDARIARLQMGGYALVSDFAYRHDRYGNRYGWGIARYSTPEKRFGAAFTDAVYRRSPEASKERILTYLKELLPQAGEKQLRRALG